MKKIYIASSWKNKHGVEMLTALLRDQGHEVISWIENCNKEGLGGFSFEEWVNTEEAQRSFKFDLDGATQCDLFIYYGPCGKDACCEMGAAWASGVKIIALWAKGEDLGLMRKMVTTWYEDYKDLLLYTEESIQKVFVQMSTDGFPMHVGDTYYKVCYYAHRWELQSAVYYFTTNDLNKESHLLNKVFSTKEAAEWWLKSQVPKRGIQS